MMVSFTIISNVAVTWHVSVNKKGAGFLLRVSLNWKKVFIFCWDEKTTLKLQKRMVLLKLLAKRYHNYNDFLPR